MPHSRNSVRRKDATQTVRCKVTTSLGEGLAEVEKKGLQKSRRRACRSREEKACRSREERACRSREERSLQKREKQQSRLEAARDELGAAGDEARRSRRRSSKRYKTRTQRRHVENVRYDEQQPGMSSAGPKEPGIREELVAKKKKKKKKKNEKTGALGVTLKCKMQRHYTGVRPVGPHDEV